MTRATDRRTVLMAAGAAAIAAAAGTVAAQSADIRGEVTFAGGTAIPKGAIEIYLEDLAIQDRAHRRVGQTDVKSDGKSMSIAFSIVRPTTATALPKLQIVARLTRADGWLLARGSVRLNATSPTYITLKAAIY